MVANPNSHKSCLVAGGEVSHVAPYFYQCIFQSLIGAWVSGELDSMMDFDVIFDDIKVNIVMPMRFPTKIIKNLTQHKK